jgi:hypothetical protein
MNLIELGIVLIGQAVICLFCVVIGAKIGQKAVRGEDIELPKFEPVKTIREYNEQKEVRKEQEKQKIIAENIDAYNGTPYGQQELPK